MTDVSFAHSDPLTIGIEEEFLLVDPADPARPAPVADQLLDGDWRTIPSPGGWLKAELLRCSIEVATAASANLAQVDVDLRALRDAVADRAAGAGASAVGIGLHPDLHVDRELVSPTDAHGTIATLHERVGTLAAQSTHGIHVHVGMPSLEEAVRVTDALAGLVPMFVALSANSPLESGQRAPWRTMRSELQRRMLWAGPTPRIDGVDEYRTIHALHQLENDGEQRFLWEVAPVPALGTVEVRSFDAHADAGVALAMAALVQATAALVLDGGELERASESVERHNRWSAMEFGMRARFLVAGRDTPVDVAELVAAHVERIRPYSIDLRTGPWLDVVGRIAEQPVSDTLLDAFDEGGVAAVLERCAIRPDAPDHGDA